MPQSHTVPLTTRPKPHLELVPAQHRDHSAVDPKLRYPALERLFDQSPRKSAGAAAIDPLEEVYSAAKLGLERPLARDNLENQACRRNERPRTDIAARRTSLQHER